ncbi:MAG: hypothetical protein ACMUIM_05325 [bacterium]
MDQNLIVIEGIIRDVMEQRRMEQKKIQMRRSLTPPAERSSTWSDPVRVIHKKRRPGNESGPFLSDINNQINTKTTNRKP